MGPENVAGVLVVILLVLAREAYGWGCSLTVTNMPSLGGHDLNNCVVVSGRTPTNEELNQVKSCSGDCRDDQPRECLPVITGRENTVLNCTGPGFAEFRNNIYPSDFDASDMFNPTYGVNIPAVYAGDGYYVGRTNYSGDWVIGKVAWIDSSTIKIFIPVGGVEVEVAWTWRDELLVSGSMYSWVSYTVNSTLPTGAFVAGFAGDGSDLYVARAIMNDTKYHNGYYKDGDATCNIPYMGGVVNLETFEILVIGDIKTQFLWDPIIFDTCACLPTNTDCYHYQGWSNWAQWTGNDLRTCSMFLNDQPGSYPNGVPAAPFWDGCKGCESGTCDKGDQPIEGQWIFSCPGYVRGQSFNGRYLLEHCNCQ